MASAWLGFKERLKIPAIAAPMFLVSGPKLVIAAAKAGIAAAFPAPNARTIEDLDQWMGEVNDSLAQADRPWAVNVVAHHSYARLKDELELIVKHKPPLVITALGSPRGVIEAVHSYGGIVFADVISMPFARKALDAGVDEGFFRGRSSWAVLSGPGGRCVRSRFWAAILPISARRSWRRRSRWRPMRTSRC
jgi:NAD(P)H-dependent flavin oxidoreductase YrpB (nitropropane dioxygenase family)